jgi:S-DNA-T family DNA segregation ATPase FtsK/SpoIIIE
VIKANLPTRISFSVTSKIDSRTILASRAPSSCSARATCSTCPAASRSPAVHGPFVSDEEVARSPISGAPGPPEYVQSVTEEPEDGGYMFEGQPIGEDDAETQLFRKAVQVVAESQKASTSYLQRQLRVGYNNAAALIERMEKEGVVSAPTMSAAAKVLVDPEGRPLV